MRQRSDRTESCSDMRQSHTAHSRCGLIVQTCARQRRLGRVLGGIRTGHIKDERVYDIDRLAVNCPPSSNDRRGGEVGPAGQCVVFGCEQKKSGHVHICYARVPLTFWDNHCNPSNKPSPVVAQLARISSTSPQTPITPLSSGTPILKMRCDAGDKQVQRRSKANIPWVHVPRPVAHLVQAELFCDLCRRHCYDGQLLLDLPHVLPL